MITSLPSVTELESCRTKTLTWQLRLQSWALRLCHTGLPITVAMVSALGCYEDDGDPIHKAHSTELAFSMSLLNVHCCEARLSKQVIVSYSCLNVQFKLNGFAYHSDFCHHENEFWNKIRVNPCNPPIKVTGMIQKRSFYGVVTKLISSSPPQHLRYRCCQAQFFYGGWDPKSGPDIYKANTLPTVKWNPSYLSYCSDFHMFDHSSLTEWGLVCLTVQGYSLPW